MKFKGTAVLVVLLLILTGWVYWTDIRGRDERAQAEEDAGKILAVDDEDIVELRLTYPDRSIAAERTGDGWEFLIPEDFEADSGQWDTVAANVTRIDRDETIAAQPTDLAQYGLAEPGIRVEVLMADGSREEILFGNENPRGTFDYVKLASSDEVFLAAPSWAGLFEKETNDLRDKTLLRFNPDAVETIEISGGDGAIELHRTGSDWLAGDDRAVDSGQVSAMLDALEFEQATGIVDDPEPLGIYGLDEPRLRVILKDSAGSVLLDAAFGADADDADHLYWKSAAESQIKVLSKNVFDAFDVTEDELLAPLPPATTTSP